MAADFFALDFFFALGGTRFIARIDRRALMR
jgi:hypothetical protein